MNMEERKIYNSICDKILDTSEGQCRGGISGSKEFLFEKGSAGLFGTGPDYVRIGMPCRPSLFGRTELSVRVSEAKRVIFLDKKEHNALSNIWLGRLCEQRRDVDKVKNKTVADYFLSDK